MHGFKSFAHKTEIPFDNKFNVILGPNGAGKSNVGDALCFVLGRLSAKSMRAEKASHLVFNGGRRGKPAQSAAVEITFDNSAKIFPEDAEEVTISRVINKDGNSTYRVNGKKRTRTEVLDLLAAARINPDGHNIVLQGDIIRFVDMSPLERRAFIEEISDVTVYEEKKHKALLELNKVEEKLNNAALILKERGVYLKELKEDRDQAAEFKELRNTVDANKATLLHLQLQEKQETGAAYDRDIQEKEAKVKEAETRIEALKEKIAGHKKEIEAINQEIEQKGEKEQLRVHRSIEELKVSLAEHRARISTLRDEISKIRQRKDQFQEEIGELKSKTATQTKQQRELEQSLVRKQKELKDIETAITQFKKKHNLESSREFELEMEKKEKSIEEREGIVQELRQQQQELLREKDKLEYQLQSIDERIGKVREVEKRHAKQLEQLQQRREDFKGITLRLTKCLDDDAGMAAQIANAKKNQEGIQETLADLHAKTRSIRANLATNNAIASIRKRKGVYGTVAELGQVEKKYALALETSAGAKMQHLVVDNDKTAAECIIFLKEKKVGAASFIPLTKIKARKISNEDRELLKQKGVHDFALDVVSFKPQYRKAFEHVFGNTIVVENIDTARQVGVGRIKMAALDGNIAEESGVMRGGYITKKLMAGFQEKDSLEEAVKLEEEIGQMETVIAGLLSGREANEKEIAALRTQRAELEATIITLEKTLHLEDTDLNATAELKKELIAALQQTETKLKSLNSSISSRNKELAELKTGKQQLRSQLHELRDPRLQAQLAAFEESRQQCREAILQLEHDSKNSSTQMTMIYPELEKIQEIIKQHDREEATFGTEIKELTEQIKVKVKELEQREKESTKFYSQYKESFAGRERISAAIGKIENGIESVREDVRTHERERNLLSLKNAEVRAKVAGLEEEFSRYKGIEIVKNKSPEQLRLEIEKFGSMLAKMSAVNMKALEVYEQVEKEFSSLIEKKRWLEKEKIDVLTLMNEIETKKKDHFMTTFTKVNDNFQRIFSSLFKKGKAYLQLDNPKNPFEDGLSVKVKLQGNRFLDIKSLSGGEKTLTALSFIFSIQEYQPSSFYVLDEVDAALDKHNSERLSQLIREYAENAQYVLISHNDAVISEADTLFGVSMNEGISKVTSLKI